MTSNNITSHYLHAHSSFHVTPLSSVLCNGHRVDVLRHVASCCIAPCYFYHFNNISLGFQSPQSHHIKSRNTSVQYSTHNHSPPLTSVSNMQRFPVNSSKYFNSPFKVLICLVISAISSTYTLSMKCS